MADPDDTGRRRKPGRINTIAGPLYDDVSSDEITDRMTVIEHAGTRAALLRLQERDEVMAKQCNERTRELEDAIWEKIEKIEAEIRQRDHKIRGDIGAITSKIQQEQDEHERASGENRIELVGKSGTNGKIGTLTARVAAAEARTGEAEKRLADLPVMQKRLGDMEAWKKAVIAAIATAALSLAGWAWTAVKVYGEHREQWADAAARLRQLEVDVDRMRVRADENRAALLRAGLLGLRSSTSFPPAPAPASTTTGDEP